MLSVVPSSAAGAASDVASAAASSVAAGAAASDVAAAAAVVAVVSAAVDEPQPARTDATIAVLRTVTNTFFFMPLFLLLFFIRSLRIICVLVPRVSLFILYFRFP